MIARHLLILLLVLPAMLDAQVLPPEIRIEAAAVIGSRSLVVWGSTRLVADTLAPVLYWQMLDGATPIGEPLPLADSTFAPTTYLQIIPFDRHFLILWNDRKYDSLTTWSTRIDTNGATEAPALFADTAVRPQGVFRFDKPDGYTLLWNRWKDSATARIIGYDVSPDGELSGVPIEIGEGWMSGIDTNVGAEGLRLIDRGAMAPLTVNINGVVEELELFQQKPIDNADSWYRNHDGSIWALQESILVNRRSITDTTTLSADSLPIPRQSGLVPRNAFVISREGAKREVYYFRHDANCCGVGGGSTSSLMEILRYHTDSGWVKDRRPISTGTFKFYPSDKEETTLIAASGTLHRFGPHCYLSNQTTTINYFKHENHPAPDSSSIFSMDVSAFFFEDTPVWYQGWYKIPLPSTPGLLDLHCLAPRESGNILLNRTSSSTESRIVVTRDMVATTLTAPAIFSTTHVAQPDRAEGSMIASVTTLDGMIAVMFVEPMRAGGQIELWDLLGRRIAMSPIESGATRSTLTTDRANAGAYIMRITHDGQIEDRIIILNE